MKTIPLDTIRIALIVAVVIISIDLYGKWESFHEPAESASEDHLQSFGPEPRPSTDQRTPVIPDDGRPPKTSSVQTVAPTETESTHHSPSPADLPEIPVTDNEPLTTEIAKPTEDKFADRLILVETDLVQLRISPRGGQVVDARMKQHEIRLDQPGNGYAVLSSAPRNYQVIQSGFVSQDGKAPTHHSIYQLAPGGARFDSDANTTTVPLIFTNRYLRVVKELIIDHERYLIRENYRLSNLTSQPYALRYYAQISSTPRASKQHLIASYIGGGYYQKDNDYIKVDYDKFDEEPLSIDVRNGWLAMIEHYFITTFVPPMDQLWRYYTKTVETEAGPRYLIGAFGPTLKVDTTLEKQLSFDYFVGPKRHDQLEEVHPELSQSIDYGILSFLSKPMFWLLSFFYGLTMNWGWSIVLLTTVVRLILYKPAEFSFRSMARMREAAPEIQQTREEYKNNREQMGVKMMEIYKTHKINPLSGCLPILLQIPVFIALYWMLLESIELRHAPWLLWINDLSAPDPFYVLPILMSGFMVIQQKLNPAPSDPMQQKILAAMPIFLGGISLFFPAGLVLYWTVNNFLSVIQQWVINKRIHQEVLQRRQS